MTSLDRLDPERYPEPSDMMLNDLYELYFPPRDEEIHHALVDWSEWSDPM
ncbi:hypothetical protein [Brevibacillus sp. SYSU BS000544]